MWSCGGRYADRMSDRNRMLLFAVGATVVFFGLVVALPTGGVREFEGVLSGTLVALVGFLLIGNAVFARRGQ